MNLTLRVRRTESYVIASGGVLFGDTSCCKKWIREEAAATVAQWSEM